MSKVLKLAFAAVAATLVSTTLIPESASARPGGFGPCPWASGHGTLMSQRACDGLKARYIQRAVYRPVNRGLSTQPVGSRFSGPAVPFRPGMATTRIGRR